MTDHLADNGDTLAHVVEKLVFAEHYRAGHGPWRVDKRESIDQCQVDTCVQWRRYLTSRFS